MEEEAAAVVLARVLLLLTRLPVFTVDGVDLLPFLAELAVEPLLAAIVDFEPDFPLEAFLAPAAEEAVAAEVAVLLVRELVAADAAVVVGVAAFRVRAFTVAVAAAVAVGVVVAAAAVVCDFVRVDGERVVVADWGEGGEE